MTETGGMSPSQQPRVRGQQVERTRQAIIETAGRLFAEHGVFSVSNRQISEAAGQGNNAAVGYHFGSKADLVRAIVRRHAEPMERMRAELIRRYDGSTAVRDWVTCTVRPFTDHLATLGPESWYARFAAQIITEPQLRELAAAELGQGGLLRTVSDRLRDCLPGLADDVRDERNDMAQTLIVHICAQRERGRPTAADWTATAAGLVDAIEGIYLAGVTR